MKIFTQIIFYTHLLGFAAVAGGLLYQLPSKTRTIGPVILNGARWQAISGLALYGLLGSSINNLAGSIKILGIVIILFLAEKNRKEKKITNTVYYVLLLVVLLMVVAALFIVKE